MQSAEFPALAKLVADCWYRAEQTLREMVKEKYPDKNEEFITELFQGELRVECDKSSADGAVERAFLRDLVLFLPNARTIELSEISRGLIATVHFHPRSVEGKTGGDFGIVLIRPDVRSSPFSDSLLTIDRDYRRGLLCQAKIFKSDSSWGQLTVSQQKVLRERLDYLALVLYRYSDQDGDRRELGPFQWQLTQNVTIEDIGGWLKSDKFPQLEGSQQILSALGRNRIGTGDNEIIDKYIAPVERPSFIINIRWRDGDGPPEAVHLYGITAVQRQQVVVQQRR